MLLEANTTAITIAVAIAIAGRGSNNKSMKNEITYQLMVDRFMSKY